MSAYREAPRPMLCPRCGDILDALVDGVRVCMACEGLWLGPEALSGAFAEVSAPEGRSMWWRNSMDCPACHLDANTVQLVASARGDTLVDRCPNCDGMYLDRGELGRLMSTKGDEIAELLARLATVDQSELADRRASWKTARAARAALIEKHAKDLEAIEDRKREEEKLRNEERARRRREAAIAEQAAIKSALERRAFVVRLQGELDTARGEHERVRKRLALVDKHVETHEAMAAHFRRQQAEIVDELAAAKREIERLEKQIEESKGGGT